MRLIDADALVEFLLKEIIECDKEYDETSEHTILGAGQEAELIRDKIKEMPTVDIVRCKDCKYWVVDYPDGEEFWSCDKWQGWAIGDYFTEDDFCSRGERKDD